MQDSKKAQTLINRAAADAQLIKDAADRLDALRTLYTSHNVDPTGTPLQGKVAAVSAWIDAVRAVADAAVANQLLAAVVPSHRGEAL